MFDADGFEVYLPMEVIEMKSVINDRQLTTDSPGETMRDGRTLPGLLLAEIGILALAVSLHLFGIGRTADGGVSAISAALIGTAGVVWLVVEHRRVVALREHPHRK